MCNKKYNNGDQVDYGYQPKKSIKEGYQPISDKRGYQPTTKGSGGEAPDNPPSGWGSEAKEDKED